MPMLVFQENGGPFVCSGNFGSAVAAWFVSVAGGGGGGGAIVVLDQKRNRKNTASMEDDDGEVNRLRFVGRTHCQTPT